MPILVKWSVTRMELWTDALSWWKCHWPGLKSADLFPRNLYLNSLTHIVTLTLTRWLFNSGVLTSLLLSHLSSSVPDSLPSLNLLCHSKTCSMRDAPKAVWSILYVSLAFLPSLKQNFIAYRSSKESSRPECIFEIHQLWQSGFNRVYSNCCCSCWFEPEIIKIGQLSHTMYSNNILNFQEAATILKACTKNVWKLFEGTTYVRSFFKTFEMLAMRQVQKLVESNQKIDDPKEIFLFVFSFLFIFIYIHICIQGSWRKF